MTDKPNFSINGTFLIKDIASGEVILKKKNLVVTGAKTIITSALVGGPSGDFISYMGLGTGTGVPLLSDVDLEVQVSQVPAAYYSDPKPLFEDQTEPNGDIIQLANVTFFGIVEDGSPIEGKSITEAGLFSAKEFMFSRIKFDAITKPTGSSWLLAWKLEVNLS